MILMSASVKGGLELKAGELKFPLDVSFPITCPPSYFTKVGTGSAGLRYQVAVTVDIPFGFDAELVCPITVPSVIPRALYEYGRREVLSARNFPSQISVGCGCCSSKEMGHIETSVEIFQTVLSLPTSTSPFNVPVPPPPPSLPVEVPQPPRTQPKSAREQVVRVSLNNCSTSSTVSTVNVELFQTIDTVTCGRSSHCATRIASATFSQQSVLPGNSMSFELTLVAPVALAATMQDVEKSLPVPTMRTPLCTTGTVLTVSYPGLDVDKQLTFTDVIKISSGVDMSNCCPPDQLYMCCVS